MTIDDAAIERLVTEAKQGDAWAFGMIFDHYHEAIYRFIASRVHRPMKTKRLSPMFRTRRTGDQRVSSRSS